MGSMKGKRASSIWQKALDRYQVCSFRNTFRLAKAIRNSSTPINRFGKGLQGAQQDKRI